MVLACEDSCTRELFGGVYIRLPGGICGGGGEVGGFGIITAIGGMVLVIK